MPVHKQINTSFIEKIGKQMMLNTFVVLEEEAAIINFYRNGQKNKQDRERQDSNVSKMMKKTMMELIAESIQEQKEHAEKTKKVLDWNSLDVKVDRKELNDQLVNNFRVMHFNKNKPKRREVVIVEEEKKETKVEDQSMKQLLQKQRTVMIKQGLHIINENSYESSEAGKSYRMGATTSKKPRKSMV